MQLTTRAFLSILIASSIAFTPTLRADSSDNAIPPATETQEPAMPKETTPPSNQDPDLATTPEETPSISQEPELEEKETVVGQGSDSRQRASKRKQLRNIGIAICAVAVAVVAMILVSSNDGHKS